MATCLSQLTVTKNCNYLLGGLARIWYCNYSHLSAYTIDVTYTLTSVTMSGSAKFYEIEFEDLNASFTNEFVPGVSKYVKQAVGFKINRKDATVINFADTFALSRLCFVCQDKTGARYLLGRVNGMTPVLSALSSGLNPGDFAGWDFSAEGAENISLVPLSTSLTLTVG